MTAWEHSLRVPLIIAAPSLVATHGRVHFGMAEMTDFYRVRHYLLAFLVVYPPCVTVLDFKQVSTAAKCADTLGPGWN
jgi:hypothetical protein